MNKIIKAILATAFLPVFTVSAVHADHDLMRPERSGLATASGNIVYGLKLFEPVNREMTPDTIGNNPAVQCSADDAYCLDGPDNLAFGPFGMMFIIEDENPGDVWVATDGDGDGIFETVELFASLEPSSQNDALWLIQKSSAPVPVPAAVWMFASALVGLVGMGRRRVK